MKHQLIMAAVVLGLFAGSPAAQTGEALTTGEVRRVDKGAERITLRHERIENLDMPPMTMVFRVRDPAMLDQVKVGERIRFAAEDIKGAITLIRIEPLRQ